jgi:hypothetical protein
MDPSLSWLVATALFGAIVGGCELIGRYRDAPFDALCNLAAFAYVAVNAAASASAYLIIVRMGWGFDASDAAKPMVQAAVASFGAMAFFRSALFNVKVGETDVAVGPAILFQILLFATDRAVDRDRGQARSDLAADIMRGVSFALAKEALPNFCFQLMQNVPLDEKEKFRQAVTALGAVPQSDMRDSVKALSLGLMLMNMVGKQVLKTAVQSLGERIQGPSALELPVLGLLRGVAFAKAFPTLVDVCFVMSKFGSDEDQAKRKAAVMVDGKRLAEDTTLDNATRVTMLALSLQQRVGDAVLVSALAQLDPALYDRAARPSPEPTVTTVAAGASAPNVVPIRAEGADETG